MIIDLFSRKVIVHEISIDNNVKMVISAFKKAFELRKRPDGSMFHSDQGVQFTAYRFRKLLRFFKVKQSFSYPGMPLDNAVVESFFSSMKVEELSHHFYTDKEDLFRDVSEYIDFFNSERLHRSLGYKTPDQIEKLHRTGKLERLNSNSEH